MMDNHFSKKTRLWTVVFAVLSLSSTLLGGIDFAYAEAGGAFGAIAGGFFTDNASLPGTPGLSPQMSAGSLAATGTGRCEKAIADASAGHQLPPGMLHAIALVESGRLDPQTGSTRPWPWTIDANGTGHVYDSAEAAIQAAAAFEAADITSLDIGCLQVNLAQHPGAFQTMAQAFDPTANADYAASFLADLNRKFGNWPQAVAAYHSQTPDLGAPYAAKVYAAWQDKQGASPALASVTAPDAAPMASAVQPAFAMTTIAPPTAILIRRGSALTGRNLASYRAAPILLSRMPPQG